MKNILTCLISFLLLSSMFTCSTIESETDFTNGTMKYISLEGGFYGIVTDDNKNLNPLNLSDEFQVDGMRIRFKYIERKEMASIHMWGMIVQITDIKEIK